MKWMLEGLRSVLSMVAGLAAIQSFHFLAGLAFPALYADNPASDPDRLAMLLLAVGAGTLGSLAVGLVARRAVVAHLVVFLLLMALIDFGVVFGPYASQPVRFKAAILLTLPLQTFIGGHLAKRIRGPSRPATPT